VRGYKNVLAALEAGDAHGLEGVKGKGVAFGRLLIVVGRVLETLYLTLKALGDGYVVDARAAVPDMKLSILLIRLNSLCLLLLRQLFRTERDVSLCSPHLLFTERKLITCCSSSSAFLFNVVLTIAELSLSFSTRLSPPSAPLPLAPPSVAASGKEFQRRRR